MMSPDGVGAAGARPACTPCAPRPSAESARRRLAARLVGLLGPARGRAAACPTSSPTTSPAAARPRRSSSTAPATSPSERYPEPRTFLTVNAVVAETQEEADRRALPQPADDGRPAHRRSRSRPAARSRRPRPRGFPRSTGRSPSRCARAGWSARRTTAAAQVDRAGRDVRRRRGDAQPGRRRDRRHPRDRAPYREETLRLLAEALAAALPPRSVVTSQSFPSSDLDARRRCPCPSPMPSAWSVPRPPRKASS